MPRNTANPPLRPVAGNTAHAPKVKFPKALMARAPGTVVEHLSEGLLIVDPADQLIYWNPAALKIYGFASGSEAIRRLPELPEIFELSTLDGRILPLDEWPLARVLRGETVDDLELRVHCRAPVWTRIFRYSGSRVHYAGHRALGFLTVNDVTERKQTELELERVNRLNIAMIDSLPGVFYFYDRQGQMLRWNRNFAAASGYSDQEISRMHPLDFFRGEDRERVAREIRTVFEQGESSVEAAFIAKDGSSRCYLFTGKRIAMGGVDCLVGMGIDIATRKTAEAATEQYARRLQATSHRLLTVQESERRTLARELHDAVGQELTALSLNLTIIDGALPPATPPKIRERLDDSQELLEETTRHLRNIMTELRPPGLDELGLLAALQEHVSQVARRSEIALSVSGVEPQPRLAPSEEIALFRIVQEALNNIVKHSRAGAAAVSLRQHSDRVELTITDNGVGFDTAAKPIMGGYGMGTTTMRERADAIGATLQLLSAPGAGTRIVVELSWPVPAGQ